MPPQTNTSCWIALPWIISAALLLGAPNATARSRHKRTPESANDTSQKPTPMPAAALAPTPSFDPKPEKTLSGFATWYDVGPNSLPQRRAGKGQFFAAHDMLPLGSFVRVTNKENGRSVVVCITDRGVPDKRVIDLCKEAALQIGLVGPGRTEVQMDLLKATTSALASDVDKNPVKPSDKDAATPANEPSAPIAPAVIPGGALLPQTP